MRPELARLHLIEQHLLHGPVGDWPLRLLLDGELAADTAAQQQLYDGLQLAGRQQLRRELAALHQRLYGQPGRWPWLHRLVGWLQGG